MHPTQKEASLIDAVSIFNIRIQKVAVSRHLVSSILTILNYLIGKLYRIRNNTKYLEICFKIIISEITM